MKKTEGTFAMVGRPPYPRINPDGVEIKFDWKRLEVGQSVFIPCINTRSAQFQIMKIAKKLGYKFRYHAAMRDGFYGLRVWRIG